MIVTVTPHPSLDRTYEIPAQSAALPDAAGARSTDPRWTACGGSLPPVLPPGGRATRSTRSPFRPSGGDASKGAAR